MATALNSFDRSPLGAFIRSPLGARGSAAGAVTLRKLGLLYGATGDLDGGYSWKNSGDPDARDRVAAGAFHPSNFVVYSGEVYVQGIAKYVPTSDKFELVASNPGGSLLAVAGGYLFAGNPGSGVLHRFDGSAWTSYDLSLAAPFFSSINAIIEHAGLLVVGGSAVTGSAGLATITPATGAIVSTWPPAFSSSAVDAMCSDGSSIYAAGKQLNNGANASDVGRFSTALSPTWLVDTSSGGTEQYTTGFIHLLAIYGGSLYAAGSITAMDVRNVSNIVAVANPVEHVMRWTGASWVQPGAGLPAAPASTGDVLVLYPTASGLLAGGKNITGVAHATNLALWDGTSWSARRYTQGVHVRHFDAATTYGITIGAVTVSVAGTIDRAATAVALAAACNASSDLGFQAFFFWTDNAASSTAGNSFADTVWAHGTIGDTRTIAAAVTGGTGTMSEVRDDGGVSNQETWSTRVSAHDPTTTYQITVGTTTVSAVSQGSATATAKGLAGAGNDSLAADFSGVYFWWVADTLFSRRYDKGALSMSSSVSGGTGTMTAAINDPNYGLDQAAITGLLDVTALNITPQYTQPAVTISAPPDLSTFSVGDSITFSGSAIDVIDGVMSSTLIWASNIDGTIGVGRTFSTTALSIGSHTITATSGQNGGGLTGSANISITVNAVDNPPVVTITSPANNSSHPAGTVVFTGAAIDDVDGNITASMTWQYQLFPSGAPVSFGTGGSASSTFTAGIWAIQAAATDSASQTGTALIFITVT